MGENAQILRATASSILIGKCGRVLYQRRDDIPNILYPGLIGLFGGHIEIGETPLEAIQREVAEETGYDAKPQNFQFLMTCDVPLPNGTRLFETVFLLKNVPTEALVITEGTLLPVEIDEIPQLFPQMTPPTSVATQTVLLHNFW